MQRHLGAAKAGVNKNENCLRDFFSSDKLSKKKSVIHSFENKTVYSVMIMSLLKYVSFDPPINVLYLYITHLLSTYKRYV